MPETLTLKNIKDICWEYLNYHKDLQQIRNEDILEIFPEIFEGGYATVQRARLKKEDNNETIVALKTLKYGLGDNTKEDQLRWVKVSLSMYCKECLPKS